MHPVVYPNHSLFKKDLFLFDVREFITCLLVWSVIYGMIFVPNIAKAQNHIEKQTQNKTVTATSSKKTEQPAEKYTASNYKNPISFEPNKGQADASVKFLAHGLGYNLFLASTEAVMVFSKPVASDKKDLPPHLNKMFPKFKTSVLRMKFVGANTQPKITSLGQLPGKRNYLSNKHKVTNIPSYSKVIYDSLYKGVGLAFYSNKQSLEYDFYIAPNTDVSTIRIKFEGEESINLALDGDLILRVDGEEVRHRKPVIYQEVAGVKKSVEGKYFINGEGEVGFKIGQYDKSKPLVIDPILSYSTYLGGDLSDSCEGLTVDKNGNAYVTGYTKSSNFPKTSGTIMSSIPSEENYQVFVTKFDAAGQHVFSTYWGGDFGEVGADIEVDNSGNIYVSGSTTSSNFPTTAGVFQTTAGGNNDAFVTKLNPTGTTFIYSTYLGGNALDVSYTMALDDTGNIFIAGWASPNFPTTSGAFQTTTDSQGSGFITKLNPSGTALIYSTFLGGDIPSFVNSFDQVIGIAIDSGGNAYVTGYTSSSNFPTTPGAFQQTYGGGSEDSFVSKLNNNGTALIYSTFLGGGNTEIGRGVIIDSGGNAYVTGYTLSLNFPTTQGAFQTTRGGAEDAFVTKLNPTGSALIYSTYLGGSGPDEAFDINIDSSGIAFVAGYSESSNFPTTNESLQTTRNGVSDSFITKLNSTGGSIQYSTYFGGSVDEVIGASYLSSCGDFYFAGATTSFDFPVRQAYQATNRSTSSEVIEGVITKLTFLSTIGTAPDATADGTLPVTVSEYKLPASIDTEVIDLTYNDASGSQPLQVELWASVYRPTTLSGTQYPLLVFLHGMHETCERNTTPKPPGAPPFPLSDAFSSNLWYPLTGRCDNLDTPAFDENPYYNIVENHRGYDYLGQKLASWGYIVVSINVNRGVHAVGSRLLMPAGYPDPALILPRGVMVLKHLQKLSEWNNCTTNRSCQTPRSLGMDLRGKLDFSNVGLFGHSRGGQGVRAAYNFYKQTGSPWQGHIPNLSIKGIFEVGPTDFETNSGYVPNPASKYVADGTKWNVLLPMCDSDVIGLSGMNAYDRILLSLSDNPSTQKSTSTVWGANHNFYNTKWTSNDLMSNKSCYQHDSLFMPTGTESAKQRQTALTTVVAFFRANVGNSVNVNFNQNFNPLYEHPSSIQSITRIERGFTPSPSTSLTTVFEDFSNTINPDNCSSGSNSCTVGGAPSVSNIITNIIPYHDESLNILRLGWTTAGNDKNLQINWRPPGTGVNISNHQTFDFRISRVPFAANVKGATNLSIQLVMANGDLSNPVKLCNYAYVDGPVGGYDPRYTSSGTIFDEKFRPVLQTVRVPITAFAGANLSQIRGIKITFNESSVGNIYLANLRFTK